MATSAGAQNQANKAIEMAKDNSLKINKIEQKVKTIENMQTDINSQKDETAKEMKDLSNKIDINTKNLPTTNNKI